MTGKGRTQLGVEDRGRGRRRPESWAAVAGAEAAARVEWSAGVVAEAGPAPAGVEAGVERRRRRAHPVRRFLCVRSLF